MAKRQSLKELQERLAQRLTVAKTLSWGEADTYREFAYLRLEENPDLASLGGPFVLMSWIVTAERRTAQPDELDVPLRQEHLEQARLLLAGVQAERSDAERSDAEQPA